MHCAELLQLAVVYTVIAWIQCKILKHWLFRLCFEKTYLLKIQSHGKADSSDLLIRQCVFQYSFRIHNKWKWVYGENEELGQGSDTNLPGGSIRPPDDPCNCYLSILVFLEWWATLVGDFILGTNCHKCDEEKKVIKSEATLQLGPACPLAIGRPGLVRDFTTGAGGQSWGLAAAVQLPA